MRILVVSGRPHIPQRSGGVPSSTHDLVLALTERGHQVAVLSGLARDDSFKGFYLRAMQKLFAADRLVGYPVYRRWDVAGSLDAVLAAFSPEIAIVQIGDAVPLARALEARGMPVLFYLHNVNMEELGGDPRTLTHVRFIANSVFTAQRYKSIYGIDSAVIPPLVRANNYIAPRDPSNVTFVNPYAAKGRDIALKIAEACPDLPFTFIESWPLGPDELDHLRREATRLPNITLRRRTDDMKSVYSKAKLILAPSLCEESWGRVATEAHFSGIPVVASDIGGLPESVGPGGILLDAKGPIEPWVEAVRRLWNDENFYREKSAAALDYAARPAIRPENQLNALLDLAAAMVA